MKAIVSVTGKDRTGIIAAVAGFLARNGINILDISQTIMHEYFVMTMLVDAGDTPSPFDELNDGLQAEVHDLGVTVHVQHEDLFDRMHRV